MEENMTPNEKLKSLCHSSKERLTSLQEEYYRACKEEYEKIEKFFNKHKDEMCIDFGEIITPAPSSYYSTPAAPEGIKERLTQSFRLSGWRNGHFEIFVPGNAKRPLTDELIDKFKFLDKASFDLINEINPIGTVKNGLFYARNIPVCYSKLLTDGKYGVIIYAVENNDEESPLTNIYEQSKIRTIAEFDEEKLKDFLQKKNYKLKIFIGKYQNNGYRCGDYAISFKRRRNSSSNKYFIVTPSGILDSVIFQNSSEFSDYVSKYGFTNDMDTNLTKLPQIKR